MRSLAPVTAPPTRDASGVGKEVPADIRRTAQEFESVFIGQILHGLMEGLSGTGVLGTGKDDVYASMIQDEYAKLISRSGGIGVADAVMREMLKMQETR
jgi:flagellar protein FlgJ